MLFYVYLSSGAKETKTPHKYPARAQQLRNLRSVRETLGISSLCLEKVPVVHGLNSLPDLQILLKLARRGQTQVVIDDVRRIFHRCPRNRRLDFFTELQPHLPSIRDLRHDAMLLCDIGKEAWKKILSVDGPPSFELLPLIRSARPVAKRIQQTASARKVSVRVRTARSDKAAALVARARGDLLALKERVTLQEIADYANAKGLRTTRGNLWTTAAVSRALQRQSRTDRDEKEARLLVA